MVEWVSAAKGNNKGGDGVRGLQKQGTENSFNDKRYSIYTSEI